MNPGDDKDDLLVIPTWLKREPKPAQPITAQPATPTPASTPPERIWIMPKSTKSKPAKSQKTDPATVAAKKAAKAAKAAKKQRSVESKAKTTSKLGANIQEYIARGKVRGLAVAPADGTTEPATDGVASKHREGSKRAKLIEMLRRPEGATIAQIVAATKWQQHTVRGAISGALKKKLGLAVTSVKVDGGERTYRIVNAD